MLFFFLDNRFITLVSHGTRYRVLRVLDGTYLSTSWASRALRAAHVPSTGNYSHERKYSSLNSLISARMASQSALEKRNFPCCRKKQQSVTTASWSERPGITWVLLTEHQSIQLVRNKSSMFISLVGSRTVWNREKSVIISCVIQSSMHGWKETFSVLGERQIAYRSLPDWASPGNLARPMGSCRFEETCRWPINIKSL